MLLLTLLERDEQAYRRRCAQEGATESARKRVQSRGRSREGRRQWPLLKPVSARVARGQIHCQGGCYC
jgi:hypothetical protein